MASFLSLPSLTQNRLLVYGATSTALAASVVLNAAATRTGFYSAAVAIAKSNGAVMILANFCLFVTLVVALALQRIFFGRLRAIEVEHLYDRSWYFVTESILALTMFREDFDAAFIVMFGLLLFLKCFHWIAADRVEWMDQLPPPGPPLSFHLRLNLLLVFLFSANMVLFFFALEQVVDHGVSGKVLFVAEYALLHVSWTNLVGKYALNVYERWREIRDRRTAAAEGIDDDEDDRGWEGKSMAVFYVDLGTDLVKLVTYLVYFCVILVHYGLPFNILRDVYLTFRSFGSRIKTLVQYRAATRNMDARYPDATKDEMDAMDDKVCIICREEMTWADRATEGVDVPVPRSDPAVAPAPVRRRRRREGDRPKKLSCNHVFHLACLKSWLERQQNCPTCRRTVMTQPPALGGHGGLPGVAAIPPIGGPPPATPAHAHPHPPGHPQPTAAPAAPNGVAAAHPAPPQPGQAAAPLADGGGRIWGAPVAPPPGFDRAPAPLPPRLAAIGAAAVPAVPEAAPGAGLTFEVAAFGYGLRIRLGQDAVPARRPLGVAGGIPPIPAAPAAPAAQPRLADAVARNAMFSRRPLQQPPLGANATPALTPTRTGPSTESGDVTPKLNVRSVVQYMAKVKMHFGEDQASYTKFLQLIQDYKSGSLSNDLILRRLSDLFPSTSESALTEGFSVLLVPSGTTIHRNSTTNAFEVHPPPSATPTAAAADEGTSSSAAATIPPAGSSEADQVVPLDISNLTPREVAAQAALRRSARLNPTPSPPPPPTSSIPAAAINAPTPAEVPLPPSPKLDPTSTPTPTPTVPIITESSPSILEAPVPRLPTLTPLYSPTYDTPMPHPHPQPFASPSPAVSSPLPTREALRGLSGEALASAEEAVRRRVEEGLEKLEEMQRGLREVKELLGGGVDGAGKGKGKGKERE